MGLFEHNNIIVFVKSHCTLNLLTSYENCVVSTFSSSSSISLFFHYYMDSILKVCALLHDFYKPSNEEYQKQYMPIHRPVMQRLFDALNNPNVDLYDLLVIHSRKYRIPIPNLLELVRHGEYQRYFNIDREILYFVRLNAMKVYSCLASALFSF